MKYENEIDFTSIRHQTLDILQGWGGGDIQRRGQNIKYLFFIINTFLYVLSLRYILQKWIFFRSDFYFICVFLGSRIWPKCDVTRRQRPMRDLVSFTLQRKLTTTCPERNFRLFAEASLFKLTGWVLYPLVFIQLRSQIGMALFTICLTPCRHFQCLYSYLRYIKTTSIKLKPKTSSTILHLTVHLRLLLTMFI